MMFLLPLLRWPGCVPLRPAALGKHGSQACRTQGGCQDDQQITLRSTCSVPSTRPESEHHGGVDRRHSRYPTRHAANNASKAVPHCQRGCHKAGMMLIEGNTGQDRQASMRNVHRGEQTPVVDAGGTALPRSTQTGRRELAQARRKVHSRVDPEARREAESRRQAHGCRESSPPRGRPEGRGHSALDRSRCDCATATA